MAKTGPEGSPLILEWRVSYALVFLSAMAKGVFDGAHGQLSIPDTRRSLASRSTRLISTRRWLDALQLHPGLSDIVDAK